MNRSWQNNSTGFVYFNNSQQNSPNKGDTDDFLAFSESPQPNRFNPSNYSSPQKFNRGNPRNFNQKRSKPYSPTGNCYNRSFNSFNSNSSLSSSKECSSRDNNSWKHNSSAQVSNVKKFVHPSFLEDPWARLESKLKEKNEKSASNSSSSGSGNNSKLNYLEDETKT